MDGLSPADPNAEGVEPNTDETGAPNEDETAAKEELPKVGAGVDGACPDVVEEEPRFIVGKKTT